MPRSRTIKRSRKKSRKSSHKSWIPESVQAFFARRFWDIVALSLLAAGALILVSLLSFDSADPSWNTARSGDGDIHNYAGLIGAYISDLLIQTVGIGGFVLAGIFMVLGLRLLRRNPIAPIWLRSLSLALAIPALSIGAAHFSSGGWGVNNTLGGTFGEIVFGPLSGSLSAFLSPDIISGIFITISAGLTLLASAVSRAEIINAAAFVSRTFIFVAAKILSALIGFASWLRHYNDPSYEPAPLGLLARLREVARQYAPEKPLVSKRMAPQPVTQSSEPPPAQPPVPTPAAEAPEPGSIPVVKPAARQEQRSTSEHQNRFNLNESGELELPDPSLLQAIPQTGDLEHFNEDVLRKNAELLQNVLADFNIDGEIVAIHPGPVVTLYELEPAPGTKTSRVISLSDDIARSMSAVSVRIAVVPGRSVIGIELPNSERQIVYMREMLESRLFEKSKAKLPLILGKDISGQPIMADLAKMPHLLVAGTTGSGKSVAVNTMVLSLLYRLPPEKCRFIMIDPKMLELSAYHDIPHLLSPVVTEPGKAVVALKWTVQEMEDRYRAMSKLGVRNIEGYNERLRQAAKNGEVLMRKVQTGFDPETGKPTYEEQPLDLTELPYIVVIVDEFADLMLVAGKDVEGAIQRLAQMARAAGIHLIMATQRPSVDVITGVVKANFPTRISFSVTSKIDSRTILGEGGAEQLLGMGDMLYMAPGGKITRVHGPFVSDADVASVTDFLRRQGTPNYIDGVTDEDGDFGDSDVMAALFGDSGGGSSNDVDELYDKAVALVAREGKASTSYVQRCLQIGYNRAARIIEEMEKQGVISKASPTGKREVLIRDFSDV